MLCSSRVSQWVSSCAAPGLAKATPTKTWRYVVMCNFSENIKRDWVAEPFQPSKVTWFQSVPNYDTLSMKFMTDSLTMTSLAPADDVSLWGLKTPRVPRLPPSWNSPACMIPTKTNVTIIKSKTWFKCMGSLPDQMCFSAAWHSNGCGLAASNWVCSKALRAGKLTTTVKLDESQSTEHGTPRCLAEFVQSLQGCNIAASKGCAPSLADQNSSPGPKHQTARERERDTESEKGRNENEGWWLGRIWSIISKPNKVRT